MTATPRRAGTTLIEMMGYMAVLTVLLGVAYGSYRQTMLAATRLSENADAVRAAVQAGEQWRADVRAATAPPAMDAGAFTLAQDSRRIRYRFADGRGCRQAGDAAESVVLEGIARAEVVRDPRRFVTAYRWELELEGRRGAAMTPRLTFIAVPAQAGGPSR